MGLLSLKFQKQTFTKFRVLIRAGNSSFYSRKKMDFLKDDNSKFLYKKYESICQSLYYGEIHKSRFLDPNELNLVLSLLNKNQLIYKIYKSHKFYERSVVLFSNIEFNLDEVIKDYITIFRIENKNLDLSHRDVLGALMSLGIDRNLIGDILVGEESVEICVLSEISDYIKFNLNSIKRNKVKIKEKDSIYMEDSLIEYIDKVEIMSSLRLDNFVSTVTNSSRNNSKAIIQKELVKKNYIIDHNPSSEISEGDCISIRGYGRFYIIGLHGKTKKNKEKVEIRRII